MLATLLVVLATSATLPADDLQPSLQVLAGVAQFGKQNEEAAEAYQQLIRADIKAVPTILAGLDGANPVGANWIRSALEVIIQREQKAGAQLPVAELKQFLADKSHAPRGRRLAFDLIIGEDEQMLQLLLKKISRSEKLKDQLKQIVND